MMTALIVIGVIWFAYIIPAILEGIDCLMKNTQPGNDGTHD